MPNTAENRSHERSGCRYSQRSFRYVVYPNWPSGHPDAPALETQDTFDGTGQVVKHVNHVRHDDTYDMGSGNIVYTMSDTTTTVSTASPLLCGAGSNLPTHPISTIKSAGGKRYVECG